VEKKNAPVVESVPAVLASGIHCCRFATGRSKITLCGARGACTWLVLGRQEIFAKLSGVSSSEMSLSLHAGVNTTLSH